MNSTDDETLRDTLRKLADETVARDVPSAAQSWSQIQFRLRYNSQGRRQGYMSTVMNVVVAIWVLLLVSWLGGVGHLAIEIGALLAAAAVAGSVLCVLTHQAIRS